MIRVALPLLLASGCHEVFGVGHGEDGGADPPCEMPRYSIDFEQKSGGDPCEPFGQSNGGTASLYREDGALVIATTAGAEEANGCTSVAMPFGPPGVFIEVESIFDHPNAHVAMNYTGYAPSDAVFASFSAAAGAVRLLETARGPGTLPFDETTRWWRMRPVDAPPGIVAEVSGDGRTWRVIGERDGTPPTELRLVLSAGTKGAPTDEQVRISQINVCP